MYIFALLLAYLLYFTFVIHQYTGMYSGKLFSYDLTNKMDALDKQCTKLDFDK